MRTVINAQIRNTCDCRFNYTLCMKHHYKFTYWMENKKNMLKICCLCVCDIFIRINTGKFQSEINIIPTNYKKDNNLCKHCYSVIVI